MWLFKSAERIVEEELTELVLQMSKNIISLHEAQKNILSRIEKLESGDDIEKAGVTYTPEEVKYIWRQGVHAGTMQEVGLESPPSLDTVIYYMKKNIK